MGKEIVIISWEILSSTIIRFYLLFQHSFFRTLCFMLIKIFSKNEWFSIAVQEWRSFWIQSCGISLFCWMQERSGRKGACKKGPIAPVSAGFILISLPGSYVWNWAILSWKNNYHLLVQLYRLLNQSFPYAFWFCQILNIGTGLGLIHPCFYLPFNRE